MKPITMYQANDESIWKTESEALTCDKILADCALAMLPLGVMPPEIVADKAYFQHDLETVLVAKDKVFEIARENGFFMDYAFDYFRGRHCDTGSIIDRILDNRFPICKAWNRFSKIDKQGREHGKTYYAIKGPDKNQVCHNPANP